MSEAVKLTDEELLPVRNLREQIFIIMSVVGQLKLTHTLMKEELKTVKSQLQEQIIKYKELLNQEKQLIDGFMEKYGTGSLDIETGVFTPEK